MTLVLPPGVDAGGTGAGVELSGGIGGGIVAVAALKVAPTDTAAATVMMQGAVPLHAPDHPAKIAPEAAVGINESERPLWTCTLQVAEQLMPLPASVTVPVPVPVVLIETAYVGAAAAGVVGTAVAAVVPGVVLTVAGLPPS